MRIPVVILLILLLTHNVFPQRYNFKTYNVEDGLSQSQVYAILQDSLRNMWFGTYGGGISKFNGVDFKYYTITEGIGSNQVICVFKDSKNNLWLGTDGNGITYFDGYKFHILNEESGLSNNTVWGISEDKNGHIWIATFKGVNVIRSWPKGSDPNIEYYNKDNCKFPIDEVMCVVPSGDGNIWAGTSGKGIYIMNSATGKIVDSLQNRTGLCGNRVRKIFFDSYGYKWIGGDRGLTLIIPKNDTLCLSNIIHEGRRFFVSF